MNQLQKKHHLNTKKAPSAHAEGASHRLSFIYIMLLALYEQIIS